jgi:hypothetical protein
VVTAGVSLCPQWFFDVPQWQIQGVCTPSLRNDFVPIAFANMVYLYIREELKRVPFTSAPPTSLPLKKAPEYTNQV